MIAVHSRTSVAGCLSSLYLREHDSVVATGGSVILATAKIFERTTYSKLRKEYLQGKSGMKYTGLAAFWLPGTNSQTVINIDLRHQDALWPPPNGAKVRRLSRSWHHMK
jgi:hypothetical protein